MDPKGPRVTGGGGKDLVTNVWWRKENIITIECEGCVK
jgi:hypothetical protein